MYFCHSQINSINQTPSCPREAPPPPHTPPGPPGASSLRGSGTQWTPPPTTHAAPRLGREEGLFDFIKSLFIQVCLIVILCVCVCLLQDVFKIAAELKGQQDRNTLLINYKSPVRLFQQRIACPRHTFIICTVLPIVQYSPASCAVIPWKGSCLNDSMRGWSRLQLTSSCLP